jgi:hypothetical protein
VGFLESVDGIIGCTESGPKVSTMSEKELRARVERVLHTRISDAEWRRQKTRGLVGEYERGVWSWEEFRDLVRQDLDQIREFVEDLRREEVGELSPETEISKRTPELASVANISAPLSERTAARVGALNALDRLRLGPTAWGIVVREMSSGIRPHGGFDGTLPQWVIELTIEAWVPADDVRKIYEYAQRVYVRSGLLVEKAPPKTKPRTYNVAQFVWEEELRCGKRPSWPVLFARWHEHNPDERFKNWRAFRTCFKRGEKATPPQYPQSDDYIASEAKEHLAIEARRLRQRLRQLPE